LSTEDIEASISRSRKLEAEELSNLRDADSEVGEDTNLVSMAIEPRADPTMLGFKPTSVGHSTPADGVRATTLPETTSLTELSAVCGRGYSALRSSLLTFAGFDVAWPSELDLTSAV
jgi:hypothetical protein